MNNAIELIDFGRETSELNYAHMIQSFHRFLVDHLSSEGNSFPHNPILVPTASTFPNSISPAPAPITQLLGIDAKNVITCLSCKAIREKENMTHVIDMIYPRKVRCIPFPPLAPSDIMVWTATVERARSRHRLRIATSYIPPPPHNAQGDLPDMQALRNL